MGIKRELTLKQAKLLFTDYTFRSLSPSSDGIIDTTYISDNYILKFYERDIEDKIEQDTLHLLRLQRAGLNVPKLLAHSKGWYLYTKLKGTSPTHIKTFHIQSLARFISSFHSLNIQSSKSFTDQYDIHSYLTTIKHSYYRYYKELESLKKYTPLNDGFIHGDIFKDNTVSVQDKIGVFDFIDGGSGSYIFDIAVALLSFNEGKRNSYTKLFLQTYNQKRRKKIQLKELQESIKTASMFYAMLRIANDKKSSRAKKLIFR